MTQNIESDPQARKPGEDLLQELKWVHNALRQDLALCQELAGQVAAGVAPEYVREQVKSLQTRSPLWKLRVNCLYYCRLLHNSIKFTPEDGRVWVEVHRRGSHVPNAQRALICSP